MRRPAMSKTGPESCAESPVTMNSRGAVERQAGFEKRSEMPSDCATCFPPRADTRASGMTEGALSVWAESAALKAKASRAARNKRCFSILRSYGSYIGEYGEAVDDIRR